MTVIKVAYDDSSQAAVISCEILCDQRTWGPIRQFYEAQFPELVRNRHLELSVPWWAFLNTRSALGTVLSSNHVTSLDVSDRVRELLGQAAARKVDYDNATTADCSLSSSQIESRLESFGFTRKLLPFQMRNLKSLLPLPAAADFSVPGAGKTTEALALFFLTKGEEDKLFVIAPKNAFIAWEDELIACVPNTKRRFIRLVGGQDSIRSTLASDPSTVIITYHQLVHVVDVVANYLTRNCVHLFIDESHRMKRGRAGVHGAAILNLSHLPRRKLLLSGTPMPNSKEDLVAQFLFLYPECKVSTEGVIAKLKPIFTRTTKSDLNLGYPERKLIHINMKPAQKLLYEALASDAGRKLSGLKVHDRLRYRKFAQCVQYMIQAASNPMLLLTSSLGGDVLVQNAIEEGLSQKLTVACQLARRIVGNGGKVVVWTTFVKTVEHLADLLQDLGAEYIHGGVSTDEELGNEDTRESKIRAFNDKNSSCKVLVANPAACSEGISLHHVCHHAIYVDRNYNAAQYLQSEDRIHRIGIPEGIETEITILSALDTIDESVARRLESKVAQMREVLDDPNLSITPLDLDEDDEALGLDSKDIADIRSLLGVIEECGT